MNKGMSKGVRIGIIIAAIVFIAVFVINSQSGDTDILVADQNNADEIFSLVLQDTEGNKVNLSDYSGVPLVINSWASWCPFCVQELPDFATVQEEFGENVLIIAINRRETPERSREFTDKLGVTGRLIFLLDENDSFYRAIKGIGMPETVFIDVNGLIVAHKRGFMAIEEMRQKINSIL